METEEKSLMQRLKDSRPSTTTMVAAAAGVVIVGTVGYSIYKANQMAKRHGEFLDNLEQQAQDEYEARLGILQAAADKGELQVVYNVARGELTSHPRYAAEFALKQGMIDSVEFQGINDRIDHLEQTSVKEIMDMKSMLADIVSPVATRTVTKVDEHQYRYQGNDEDRVSVTFSEPTSDWLSEMLQNAQVAKV